VTIHLRLALAAALHGAVASGCAREAARPAAPAATPPPAPAAAPPAEGGAARIDAVFRAYRREIPRASNIAEANGTALMCPHHGGASYTLLHALAAKLPIVDDRDFAALVPWMRDDDECIRHIAVAAFVDRVGFDTRHMSGPSMHDPEHVDFHEILVALKRRLDERRASYDPKIFAGLLLDVGAEAFGPVMYGTWEQDVDPRFHNFQYIVQIDAELIRVTHHATHPDPHFPDETATTKLKDVRANERHQFVITGAWDEVSNTAGVHVPRVEPSATAYVIWPVQPGLAWMNGVGDWIKLRKKTGDHARPRR
jgi:hypothetical protein